MGESSKVGISASKVVALIGILILIRDSIFYFYTTDWVAILFGVFGLIIAFVVFDSLEIIDFKKRRYSHESSPSSQPSSSVSPSKLPKKIQSKHVSMSFFGSETHFTQES